MHDADGSLDINPAVIPQLGTYNDFTGQMRVEEGLSLLSPDPQPECSLSTRGLFWYTNGGQSKDSVQVCVWSGTAFTWISLY